MPNEPKLIRISHLLHPLDCKLRRFVLGFHRKVQTSERRVKSSVLVSPVCRQPRRLAFIAFDYTRPAIELVNHPSKQNIYKKIIFAIDPLRNPVLESDRAVTHMTTTNRTQLLVIHSTGNFISIFAMRRA